MYVSAGSHPPTPPPDGKDHMTSLERAKKRRLEHLKTLIDPPKLAASVEELVGSSTSPSVLVRIPDDADDDWPEAAAAFLQSEGYTAEVQQDGVAVSGW